MDLIEVLKKTEEIDSINSRLISMRMGTRIALCNAMHTHTHLLLSTYADIESITARYSIDILRHFPQQRINQTIIPCDWWISLGNQCCCSNRRFVRAKYVVPIHALSLSRSLARSVQHIYWGLILAVMQLERKSASKQLLAFLRSIIRTFSEALRGDLANRQFFLTEIKFEAFADRLQVCISVELLDRLKY
jgi:hypothetical protein